MFFGKKQDKTKCPQCKSGIKDSFSFCPYCGADLLDPEQERKDFGMLGKNDMYQEKNSTPLEGFGITDQMINSIIGNLAKTLNRQFKEIDGPRIENLPNGIKIKIGPPTNKEKNAPKKRTITEDQIQKMSEMPRIEAKSNIRRFSDKVVYEMSTPGLESQQDVFISKLESGYEIKAIGNKKIYVNSLQIDLPIYRYIIEKGRLLVEFKTKEH